MDYDVLTSVFGKSVQIRIIEFFLVNEEGIYQLTEIAKLLGVSHSQVHERIDNLVRKRLLLETKSSRNRLFELNKNHPITKQLKDLYSIIRAYNLASQ
ncbi:MAG: MarR family transcriptional regulator [Asgard group archaeon]|nr:MarR family transcriptional regulator [Asgard group archaeon]